MSKKETPKMYGLEHKLDSKQDKYKEQVIAKLYS